MTLNCSGKIVEEMQNQMKEMKSNLQDSRVGIELKRQESNVNIKKKTNEDTHPLVKKIETVMNIYTKFL
jgi:phenylalanyl-tRNA synthetase alpha subunit